MVPHNAYDAEQCLALPKLNLQFLTLTDYLMRNFQLFRLEATAEIKDDIEVLFFLARPILPICHTPLFPISHNLIRFFSQDALTRMQPRAHRVGGGTLFKGWARMALPVQDFRLFKVGKPFLGESRPSEVRAEATLSLQGANPEVSREWSELKRHDVVFLLTIRAATPDGERPDGSLPFPSRIGLAYVRGAEVAQVRKNTENTKKHIFSVSSPMSFPPLLPHVHNAFRR